MSTAFWEKVAGKLDKLDSQSLQTHFLQLAQEKGVMEAIFQAIQEGVLVLDSQGRISYANRASEKMLGVGAGTLVGKPISRYLREIDWDLILKMDTGEWSKVISHEIEINLPQPRYLSFYLTPLPLNNSSEKGLLLMLRDVTRDRMAETTLLESERLNAVKLLAAGVAHEIGNPLNALNIHLQLIDRRVAQMRPQDQESIRELLDVTKKEVSRLDMIITQFLRAIRPAQPQLAPTRIEDILQETLTLLKQEIENRRIGVEIDSHGVIPAVPADSHQIKQAFFNVIKNALQAMPDGGLLAIGMSRSERFLTVAFRDTGKGMTRDELGLVFEPYHTTKTDGSGLGLMIVQRIVHDHGGAIEIDSRPGAGATVSILLPLAERQGRLLKARSTRTEARKED